MSRNISRVDENVPVNILGRAFDQFRVTLKVSRLLIIHCRFVCNLFRVWDLITQHNFNNGIYFQYKCGAGKTARKKKSNSPSKSGQMNEGTFYNLMCVQLIARLG